MESFYSNFLTLSFQQVGKVISKISFTLLLLSFFTNYSIAQIIPNAGATECFVAGEGAVFVDHGGTVDNPAPGSDPAGDYFNCNCETVTTLCSPDGSALTLDFTSFSVFATFDFVQIFEGDTNTGTPIYNNGVGGTNAGDITLDDMIASNGSSSFTSPSGCITISLFATTVVNDPGWEATVSIGSGAAHPGDNLPCGVNLDCLAPVTVSIDQVTSNSAGITWSASDSADAYIYEYGPVGFTPGSGTTMTTTQLFANITGLNQNTAYDFYVQSDCGDGDFSNIFGPTPFTTIFENPCDYTIELFDSFGDGWNGSVLTVTVGTLSTDYTILNGGNETFVINAGSNFPMSFTYTAGAFQNEVSYNVLDADGVVIFSDGPFPATGDVFSTFACPTCPGPTNISTVDLTNNTTTVTWTASDSADVYIFEYGPAGFTPGTGTTINTIDLMTNLSGLTANTAYDVYIQSDCGDGDFSVNGTPFTFTTLFDNACNYTIELFDSFGDGWNGSILTATVGTTSTDYTILNGDMETFVINVGSNFPMSFTYTAGAFQNEVSYNIIDADGVIVFSDGPFPATGDVFSTFACPTCPGPSGISTVDLSSNTTTVTWIASDSADAYIFEYGPAGFTPGTGTIINTTDTMTELSGLTANTDYDVYIQSDCSTEISINGNPFTFTTLYDNPCDYTLELFDSFGDGWNGSVLTVTVGTTSTDYTFETGGAATFTVGAGSNLPLIFTYTAGAFQNEVSYNILDADGVIIFSDGPFPQTGIVLETFACPSCPGATDLVPDDIFALSADVSWTDSDSAGVYQIEYGPTGFMLGAGTIITTPDPFTTLTGLEEKSTYDFYVIKYCDNGDSSAMAGPTTFTTIPLDDVGIVAISSPNAGCGLTSSETISVTLQNFGANPQALIPFFYSVNGVPASITIPLDGYFTDVIGKDSMVTLDFEATYDFSAPGEYVIAAWSEMDDDSEIGNDTTFFTLVSIPTTAQFPSNQNFEEGTSGWAVTDDSANSSWAFGQPNGNDIPNAASGVNAWVTNLNGNYNNNEEGFFISNCFDFSGLTSDPTISLSVSYDTETAYDGGWLDISLDGGNSWEKVGELGTGVNWYNINNVNTNLGDVWAGQSDGWLLAKHPLVGVAGEADVRFRFAFDSDGSVNGFDGLGIDDVAIFVPVENDMYTQNVINTNVMECGSTNDSITITIINNGTLPQTGFDVAYQVNNETPIVENVGALTLQPDEVTTYTFMTPFSSTETGVYTITAWTELAGELNLSNDTTSFEFETYRVLPFREDFEVGTLPNGWTSTANPPVTDQHGNITFVASALMSSNNTFQLVSPPVGPIATGDSLTFDYKYVDFNNGNGNIPTFLGTGNTLEIQASIDCGTTYNTIFTIDSDSHSPSINMETIGVGLSSIVGESVKFRFLATWASGNYFLDIDNINIFQCANLDLATTITQESIPGAADGTASVQPSGSMGPYTFSWDNGETTAEISDLLTGAYTVTVTDIFGCESIATTDVTTNTTELEKIQSIKLFPNPTADMATLEMSFSKSVDVQVQVINMIGQILFETSISNTTAQELELDLQDYSDGMYFVRIKVDDQTTVKKLMKSQP